MKLAQQIDTHTKNNRNLARDDEAKNKLFSPKFSYNQPGHAELLEKKFRRQRVLHAARTAIQRGIFFASARHTPTEHQHTGKIN